MKRLQGNADMAKRFLMRAQEVATEVLGSNHHYVAAITGQVWDIIYYIVCLTLYTLINPLPRFYWSFAID